MRALETFIRNSSERLSSQGKQGWLTPERSRRIVIFVLAAGCLLVAIWTGVLAWLLYQLTLIALG